MRSVLVVFLMLVATILLISLVFSFLVISEILNHNIYEGSNLYNDIKFSMICVIPQVLIMSGIFYFLIRKKIIEM